MNYVVSAVCWVSGCKWDKNKHLLWNEDIFFSWGKTVGEMHRLTQKFIPLNNSEVRDEFDIRSMFGEGLKHNISTNKIAEKLINEIELLPKTKNSYGLIHNDLHPNNFLIDNNRVVLIDFDSCAYSWFAFDIGNALYTALWFGRKNDEGKDFANDIIRCFLKGYLSENSIEKFWLSKIPLFMMVCKLALLSFGCDSENINSMLDEKTKSEQLLDIENNILFSDCNLNYELFK